MFTLIEMLVVVAIILILAAMLMPTLSTAVERGRFTTCAGNLKQLQTASLTYSGDNKRRLLEHRGWVNPAYGDTWSTSTAHIEDGTLYPYTRSLDIHVCPTFDLVSSTNEPYRSYSMNWNIGSEELSAGSQKLSAMSVLTSPSTMIMFTEENHWTRGGYNTSALNDGSIVAGPIGSPIDNVGTYHFTPVTQLNAGWAAASFADGHVARVQLDDPFNQLRQ